MLSARKDSVIKSGRSVFYMRSIMLSVRKDSVIKSRGLYFSVKLIVLSVRRVSVLYSGGLCCQNEKEVLLSGGRASH